MCIDADLSPQPDRLALIVRAAYACSYGRGSRSRLKNEPMSATPASFCFSMTTVTNYPRFTTFHRAGSAGRGRLPAGAVRLADVTKRTFDFMPHKVFGLLLCPLV
jgi:hypothetical protein